MNIDLTSFRSTPSLPTFFLEGCEEANCRLLFSNNDQWLIALGDSGRLQVWDVPSRRKALVDDTVDVRGVAIAEHLGSILAVVAGSLVLFRHTPGGFATEVRTADLPGISQLCLPESDDYFVAMTANASEIVCCTRQFTVVLDPRTLRVINFTRQLDDQLGRLEHISFMVNDGMTRVRRIISVRRADAARFYYTSTVSSGVSVDEMILDVPGCKLLSGKHNRSRPAIISCTDGIAVVVGNSEAGAIKLFSLAPCERGMTFTASEAGTAIAGMTSAGVTYWKGSELVGRMRVEAQAFDVKLVDSARFAMMLFCDDVRAPDLAGLIDPYTGTPLGHCGGHVIGLAPAVFSESHRFFATFVTDGTSAYHPGGVGSGTVVLTDLSAFA